MAQVQYFFTCRDTPDARGRMGTFYAMVRVLTTRRRQLQGQRVYQANRGEWATHRMA